MFSCSQIVYLKQKKALIILSPFFNFSIYEMSKKDLNQVLLSFNGKPLSYGRAFQGTHYCQGIYGRTILLHR